jgi:hypothetical protein
MSRFRNTNRRGKNDAQCLALAVSILVLCIATGVHIVAGIQFDRNYAGHLKRAADANNLKLAEQELVTAVEYLEDNDYHTESGRCQGRIDDYTSIVYSTPDEQISFHYNNVSVCLANVRKIMAKGDKATPLERSNELMKLRETLLDDGQYGQSVTYPGGLDVYPHNTLLAFLLLASSLVGVVSLLLWNRN